MYAELVRLGAPMRYIMWAVVWELIVELRDGVVTSIGYDMQNYANDIIAALKDMCTRAGTPAPLLSRVWSGNRINFVLWSLRSSQLS